MKHRGVEYGVEEDRPGFWRWIIYEKMEDGQKVVGEAKYTRSLLVWASVANDGSFAEHIVQV